MWLAGRGFIYEARRASADTTALAAVLRFPAVDGGCRGVGRRR
jgi:hypothetical protein